MNSDHTLTRNAPEKNPLATWICALAPAFAFLVFLSMALHVRAHYGKWPDNAIDNFPTVSMNAHMLGMVGSVLLAISAAPLGLLFIFFRDLRLHWAIHVLQLLVYLLGWLFFVGLETQDGHWLTWCLD